MIITETKMIVNAKKKKNTNKKDTLFYDSLALPLDLQCWNKVWHVQGP